MIAVIYRFYVKKGFEETYQKAWSVVALYFKNHRGALGSSLHKGEDCLWVAYSRWPDEKTRKASWPTGKDFPDKVQKALDTMKACTDQRRKLPEISLNVMSDLL